MYVCMYVNIYLKAKRKKNDTSYLQEYLQDIYKITKK
jgi:hypothetical protein